MVVVPFRAVFKETEGIADEHPTYKILVTLEVCGFPSLIVAHQFPRVGKRIAGKSRSQGVIVVPADVLTGSCPGVQVLDGFSGIFFIPGNLPFECELIGRVRIILWCSIVIRVFSWG